MLSRKSSDKVSTPGFERRLNRLAGVFLRHLKVKGANFDIIFLPDKKIAALKARFIKKKTEPNVLAFPEPLHFPHPETKKRYLGEIYLNGDILRREPERAPALLLHGLLHLLGYDHKKDKDARRMEKLEKKLLSK